MTDPGCKPDGIELIYKPLPELDGITFTSAVVKRTKRIQHLRTLARVLTYLCLSAVFIATAPWRSMTAGIEAIFAAVNPPAMPARQIGVWTEWLQSVVTLNIQTQQLVLTAALISLICATISFVMTEV